MRFLILSLLVSSTLLLAQPVAASSQLSAQNQPVIAFGQTAGEVAGMCGKAPALTPGFSVKTYAGGRVVVWNIARESPYGALAKPKPLIRLARRLGFFGIASWHSDVSCKAAATVYIMVRNGATVHRVMIRGYLASRHPVIARLLDQFERAVGV